MKNTLILLSVLVSCVLLQAQSPFMRAIGTTGDDFANSIEPTSDGGFIVAGYTSGSGAGGQDVLLVKLDASCAIQWAKTAGGTINDTAFHVRQSSDAGYIATGQTNSVTGVGQVLLTKFDGNGTIQWTKHSGKQLRLGSRIFRSTNERRWICCHGISWWCYRRPGIAQI